MLGLITIKCILYNQLNSHQQHTVV